MILGLKKLPICLAAAVCSSLTADGQNQRIEVSGAVDAQGVRHVAKGRAGPPQWFTDMVRKRIPDYPYSERSLHHEGSGFFRLILDLKTGTVTKIDIGDRQDFRSWMKPLSKHFVTGDGDSANGKRSIFR
jgi:hypothetical protein